MPLDRISDPDAAARYLAALGTVVRRHRDAAKLTQDALEESSTIDVRHVRGIEAGRRNPSFLVLVSLAGGLDVSLDILIADVLAEARGAEPGGDDDSS